MPLFDTTSRNIILNYMRERGYNSNNYVEISELIPQYTPKQIRQFWTNTLDPRLNHSRLGKEEEDFIVGWIENRDPNVPMNWSELINDIHQRFDKLRPKNKIKNFWYSRIRRRQGGQVRMITNRINRINRMNRVYDHINNSLHSNVTSRFNSYPIPQPNSSSSYSSINSPIPNISYTNYSIPQPNPLQYSPLQSISIPITPHYNNNQHHTIRQPIPTINPTVLHTLQPKPDPPQFNEPNRMKPI